LGWADPLKAWGGVLAKQGNTKDALVKFRAALKSAPNWKQLKKASVGGRGRRHTGALTKRGARILDERRLPNPKEKHLCQSKSPSFLRGMNPYRR